LPGAVVMGRRGGGDFVQVVVVVVMVGVVQLW